MEQFSCPRSQGCVLPYVSFAVARLDHEGRFHGCNAAFARLVGHSAADLEGDLCETIVDPADRESLRRAIRETEEDDPEIASSVDVRLLDKWDRAIPCRMVVCRIVSNGYRHMIVVDQLMSGSAAPQRECGPAPEWWEVAIARTRENWVFLAAAATLVFKFGLDYQGVKTTQAIQERQFAEIRAVLDRLADRPPPIKTQKRQEGP